MSEMSINSTASLNAMLQMNLLKATTSMNMSALRMSTGLKINSMADGAVSYITASNLQQSIRGWQGAQESTQKGISLLNTTKNSLSSMKSILNQLNGLADTASSSTLSAERRAELQKQADLLIQQLYNKKDTTRFDGVKIFGEENNSTTIIPGTTEITTTEVIGTTTTVGVTTTETVKEVLNGLIKPVEQMTIKELEAAGYTVITSAAEFRTQIVNNLDGKFALFGNLDFASMGNIAPIDGFTGELNGNGFALKNVTINSPALSGVGLFGQVTSDVVIKNLIAENFNVTGGRGTGALIGVAMGGSTAWGSPTEMRIGTDGASAANLTIDNVAIVGGSVNSNQWSGGAVGIVYGGSTISNSWSSAEVNATGAAGGLIGLSQGTKPSGTAKNIIDNCYATGNVSGNSNYNGEFGGLIGRIVANDVKNSWASGDVSGGFAVGGLVGAVYNNPSISSTITNSYATGNVNSTGKEGGNMYAYAGGLVGVDYSNTMGASISNSWASGNVTAVDSMVGGLVGYSRYATINNCFATGGVIAGKDSNGASYAGGLVGKSDSTITNSYATGNVIASGNYVGGFIGCGFGLIKNSYAKGSVIITTAGSVRNIGGFGGYASAQNSYSTGDVSAEETTGENIGGFVGQNTSGMKITNSYSTGDVRAKNSNYVGGFVGQIANIEVSNSYATGETSGNNYVGGFAGISRGTIKNSYATGDALNMYGPSAYKSHLGGFVGYTNTTITGSWSSGDTKGSTNSYDTTGGFVGTASATAVISNSYSKGLNSNVGGGFAGMVESGAKINNVYYNNEVYNSVANGSSEGITGLSITSLNAINTRVVNNDLYTPTIQKVTGDITTGATTIAITSMTQFLSLVTTSTISADKTFVLMTDLDFNGINFNQIRTFSGTLDGNGHTIKNISTSNSLFTEITGTGTVKDLVLDNILIYGSSKGTLAGISRGIISNVTVKNACIDVIAQGSNTMGGLVGVNDGRILMSQVVSGSINISGNNSSDIGGLVGVNHGSIENSYSGINIGMTAGYGSNFGGLVGNNEGGSVVNSRADGIMSLVAASNVGGLVGLNYGGYIDNSVSGTEISISGGADDVGGLVGENSDSSDIVDSMAFGNVFAINSNYVGGLVGYITNGSILNSSAMGQVAGDTDVGGLVGLAGVCNISDSYSGGSSVSGNDHVGGLIGRMATANTVVSKSYSEMDVSGNDNVGGFVGFMDYGKVSNSYSTGMVSGVGITGGFIGSMMNSSSIDKAYSTGFVEGQTVVGGFVGSMAGAAAVTASFFDKETSGCSQGFGNDSSSGARIIRAATSAQMADFSVFQNQGWSPDIWESSENGPVLRNFSAGNTWPATPPRWTPPVAKGSVAIDAGLSSPITGFTGSTVVVSTTQKTFTTKTTTTTEKMTTTEVVTTTSIDSKSAYVKNANQYNSIYTSYTEGQSLATSIDTGMTFGKIYFDTSNEDNAKSSKAVIESLISKVNEKERTTNSYLDSLNYSVQFQKTNIDRLNEQYDSTVKADMTEEKINYTRKQIVLDNISSVMAQTARMRYSPLMTLLGVWK